MVNIAQFWHDHNVLKMQLRKNAVMIKLQLRKNALVMKTTETTRRKES